MVVALVCIYIYIVESHFCIYLISFPSILCLGYLPIVGMGIYFYLCIKLYFMTASQSKIHSLRLFPFLVIVTVSPSVVPWIDTGSYAYQTETLATELNT